MMEMASLLGPLISVGSSEPRRFAAKQNVGEEILLNLYWGKKASEKTCEKRDYFLQNIDSDQLPMEMVLAGKFLASPGCYSPAEAEPWLGHHISRVGVLPPPRQAAERAHFLLHQA